MSLSDDLAVVLARDPRYTIHAYVFVFDVLEFANGLKKRARGRGRGRPRSSAAARHVSGRELCEGARRLALENYGLLALTVLNLWGVKSTSDIGELVYNLIEAGDLEETASDSRADFKDVFDFEEAFLRGFVVPLDDVAST